MEAVRFKRLSQSDFAPGWIPLIYDGKESQSAAVSPEMPWQVNCILSLLTNSKDACTLARRARTAYRGAGFSSGIKKKQQQKNRLIYSAEKVSSSKQPSYREQRAAGAGDQIWLDCGGIITEQTLIRAVTHACLHKQNGWLMEQ